MPACVHLRHDLFTACALPGGFSSQSTDLAFEKVPLKHLAFLSREFSFLNNRQTPPYIMRTLKINHEDEEINLLGKHLEFEFTRKL